MSSQTPLSVLYRQPQIDMRLGSATGVIWAIPTKGQSSVASCNWPGPGPCLPIPLPFPPLRPRNKKDLGCPYFWRGLRNMYADMCVCLWLCFCKNIYMCVWACVKACTHLCMSPWVHVSVPVCELHKHSQASMPLCPHVSECAWLWV